MIQTSDFLRTRLTEEVGALLRAHLDETRSVGAIRLLAAYLDGIETADLETADAETIYGAVMSLSATAADRPAESAAIHLYNPDPERNGWASRHSVIEIVNDDMPFLVDSISGELSRRGIAVHLLVHPILAVRRDKNGRLAEIGAANAGTEGMRVESWMHVEIDRQDDSGRADLAARLTVILRDVRAAVTDWAAMQDVIAAATAALDKGTGRSGDDDADAEARAFLDWLCDERFTFLGARYFAFSGADDSPDARIEGPGLGVLRDPDAHVFDESLPLAAMPDEVHAFLRRPDLLLITKSAGYSTVHRPVHMDVIGVKKFDSDGKVIGLTTFVGLFTSAAYTVNPMQIPLLRRKVAQTLARAGFPPLSHDAKVLGNILETYPRDELFQIDPDTLFTIALGILHLTDRPRAALFVRHDEFRRFVSCLVFVPRDRYDTPLRLTIQGLLETAFGGTLVVHRTQVSDRPLARLHMIVRVTGPVPEVNERDIENRIADAARSWSDHLRIALVQAHGETAGLGLARRYADAFPASYMERYPPLAALADIERIERVAKGEDFALGLSRPIEAAPFEARLKLYHARGRVVLSDVLPMLEAMGLTIIAEVPHAIRPADSGTVVWLHDFEVESPTRAPIDLESRGPAFETALIRIARGEAESDGLNRLVLNAGLDGRQVAVLRAYSKYMRQIGSAYSQDYIARALAKNPAVAAALMAVFLARFDPATGDDSQAVTKAETALAAVDGADDDRILRRFLTLIRATLRTNYFQTGTDGGHKPYLSLKLDSRAIDDLPLPRPLVEIWVCSPQVEAVHLRGGRVARGGIRWSDRREDFRTEILGLMKAQMVKNAVIVPVGAKGGFVIKRPPAAGDREAMQAEAIACYRVMMRGLLDLTDNLVGDRVVPPTDTVCHDGDDPYLVVAADKGTASFSDIANGISAEYGFWLGDAFASGGSHGYDHKAMGITARGAWKAVRRHFQELGVDCQTEPFTAVGVGDMSGDVFGNGMLRSRATRLVGAFNHAHIFIDPNPDPERSFVERERLFRAVRSWPDYDTALISPGGGVFARSAKTIPVSPEMRARFGLDGETVTPDALIRALLRAPVDLLFFGGVGTYVKAHTESHLDAGDRANDRVRVDGRDLKARVVGEGANLALTQLGRIEFALAGGRLNTDAIDNSAGVDTSDHEVNIKILLDGLVAEGDLPTKQRDALLVAMTDEIGHLVLRDNILQTQALSVMEAQAPDLLDAGARFMRLLEKSGRLDRTLEFLPDDETLTRRAAARRGLVRPELAVPLAYAKIWLHDAILPSDLPDDPYLAGDVIRYFPTAIRERFEASVPRHRLRRELAATAVTNDMINRVGIVFVSEMMEKTGHQPADIAGAFIVARDAYRLPEVWDSIENAGVGVDAATRTDMLIEANRLLERATAWVLRFMPAPLDIGGAIGDLASGIQTLEAALDGLLPPHLDDALATRTAGYIKRGVPDAVARRVGNLIVLASAADIVRVAARHRLEVETAGALYFAVGARFGLGRLRAAAETLSVRGHWEKLAAAAVIEDLYGHQRDITDTVAGAFPTRTAADALAAWIETKQVAVEQTDTMLAEIGAAGQIDLAMLAVASHRLRALGP